MPGAGKPESYSPHSSLQPDAESGLKNSPVHFLKHVNIQSLIHHNPIEPLILTLELPQPFRIISLHPAVLVAPPVIRLLGHLEMLTHLHHRAAITEHSVSLPQLTHNLFRGVMPSFHIAVLLAHKGNQGPLDGYLRLACNHHLREHKDLIIES